VKKIYFLELGGLCDCEVIFKCYITQMLKTFYFRKFSHYLLYIKQVDYVHKALTLNLLCLYASGFQALNACTCRSYFKHFETEFTLISAILMWVLRSAPQDRDLSLCHLVQIHSGAHRASSPMETGHKAVGCDADHSPPSSAKVMNAWSYTSTPPYVFTAWCIVKHSIHLHGMVLC
jgi:hypothetical protein